MRTFLIIVCSIFTTASFAQTKLIAFKSHSGNMNNFRIAMETELFNENGSNFGTPPYRTVNTLDSVIYLSPTAVILIKKENRFPWGGIKKDSGVFISMQRDTVYNDPLFSSKRSLDTTNYLTARYFRETFETKKTVFIGFKKIKTKEKKKDNLDSNQPKENNIFPIVVPNNDTDNNSPFDAAMLKALAGIFLLALLGGWLSTKFYSLRLQKA